MQGQNAFHQSLAGSGDGEGMLGPGISQLNICGWHWKENLSFDLAQGVSGTREPWPSSPLAPGLTMGDCAPGDAVTHCRDAHCFPGEQEHCQASSGRGQQCPEHHGTAKP